MNTKKQDRSCLLFFYGPNSNIIQLKINSGNIKGTIAQVESSWKKYFPQLPFEHQFLDEDFNSQICWRSEAWKNICSISILIIIINCLGLLGLTAFTNQQKQKEISMRRIVMGASIVLIAAVMHFLWHGISCTTNWLGIF